MLLRSKKVDTGSLRFFLRKIGTSKIPLKENFLKTRVKISIINGEGKGFEWGPYLEKLNPKAWKQVFSFFLSSVNKM